MEFLRNIFKAFFFDNKTNQFSTSKFWLNVGYIAITWVFIQTTLTWELLTAYGAIVAGNNVAIFWLKRKYDAANPNPDSSVGG